MYTHKIKVSHGTGNVEVEFYSINPEDLAGNMQTDVIINTTMSIIMTYLSLKTIAFFVLAKPVKLSK